MGLLDKLLGASLDKFMEKHRDELITAMGKVNSGGDEGDVETIAQDYAWLLKNRSGLRQIRNIRPSDGPYTLTVDGRTVDFDELVRHDDTRGAGCKSEIEALMTPALVPAVEKRLNELFS